MSIDENSAPPPESPQPRDATPDSTEQASIGSAARHEDVPNQEAILAREFPAPAGAPVPEDLRAPWGWLDLLVFAVLAVAGAFAISLLVTIVFAAFGVKLAQLRGSPSIEGLFAVVSQALMFLALLAYLAVQMRVRFGVPFWRAIGWRPLDTGRVPRALAYFGFVAGGFVLSLVVQILSAEFGSKAKLPMEELFQDRRTALLVLLLAVFVAPVVEETVFRGYIYPVIARSFGVSAGIIATGTLFGLLHAPQLWGGWVEIALLVLVGVVLSYARAVKHTVFASYLIHASYNLSIALAFLIGSHGLRVLTPGP
jgi:membrane protease YdiL (CAAX protease family)